MSDARGLMTISREAAEEPRQDEARTDDEWLAELSSTGAAREAAVAALRDLMARAAGQHVNRVPDAARLGAVRRAEIIETAADDATMSVLARLGRFEGRSKFTTWAYKFGILHAGVELRRAVWRDRDVPLHGDFEPRDRSHTSPEAQAEGHDLARAVRAGLVEALTTHQRHIATALLIDEIPIDVLAERLGTNRSALYKTLHDARKRLRSHLTAAGYILTSSTKEVGA